MTATINAAIRRKTGKPAATPAHADRDRAGDPADPDTYLAGLAALQEDDPRAWESLSVAARVAAQTYAAVLAATEQEEIGG